MNTRDDAVRMLLTIVSSILLGSALGQALSDNLQASIILLCIGTFLIGLKASF